MKITVKKSSMIIIKLKSLIKIVFDFIAFLSISKKTK